MQIYPFSKYIQKDKYISHISSWKVIFNCKCHFSLYRMWSHLLAIINIIGFIVVWYLGGSSITQPGNTPGTTETLPVRAQGMIQLAARYTNITSYRLHVYRWTYWPIVNHNMQTGWIKSWFCHHVARNVLATPAMNDAHFLKPVTGASC